MKILTIDGGGIFGCIPAYLIAQAEDAAYCNSFRTHPFDIWDAFAGTSVGSEIALAYAHGHSGRRLYNAFTEDAAEIFNPSILRRLNPRGAKHNDEALNKSLSNLLPQPFGSLLKPCIVPAYDFEHKKIKVFDNISIEDDVEIPTWEIARMSSAAPTYLDPWKGMIDGGVVANNPTIIAKWALEDKMGIKAEDMEILSIGTGWTPRNPVNMKRVKKWTKLGWLDPIVELLVEGNTQLFTFGSEHENFKRYERFDPVQIEPDWNFDNPRYIKEAVSRCEPFVDEFVELYNSFMEK